MDVSIICCLICCISSLVLSMSKWTWIGIDTYPGLEGTVSPYLLQPGPNMMIVYSSLIVIILLIIFYMEYGKCN